jgi:hypothetical protein
LPNGGCRGGDIKQNQLPFSFLILNGFGKGTLGLELILKSPKKE